MAKGRTFMGQELVLTIDIPVGVIQMHPQTLFDVTAKLPERTTIESSAAAIDRAVR